MKGNKIGMWPLFLWQESKNLGYNIVLEYLIIQHTSGIPLRPQSLVQVSSVEIFVVPALLDQSDSQIQGNLPQALSSFCLNNNKLTNKHQQ